MITKKTYLSFLLFIMSIFLFGNSFSQTLETSFNGNSYVLIDNHWNLFTQGYFTKTENKIYVKSYNITPQEISYVVTNTTSKIIQTNNFSNGTHTILLICDGVIKDVKQFVKV